MSLIHEKIIAVMQDIEAIGKDKFNQQQGFKFRGIDDVYNSLHPLLAKHGVFTVTKIIDDKTEERKTMKGNNLIYRIIKIEYSAYTSDGSSIAGIVIGEGMDSGDKATNKAMAIAHKYFLMQLFCIPTEDLVDPDAETHVVAPKEKKIEKTGLLPKHVKAIDKTIEDMQKATEEEAAKIYADISNKIQESIGLTEEAINEALEKLSSAYMDLAKVNPTIKSKEEAML